MKKSKRILSALIASAILATTSIAALAAPIPVEPPYSEIIDAQLGETEKDVEIPLEGIIYPENGRPTDPELSLISVRVPTRLIFAVHRSNPVGSIEQRDIILNTPKNYYFENLSNVDLDVTLTNMKYDDSTGTSTSSEIDFVPQAQTNLKSNQVALAINLSDKFIDQSSSTIELANQFSGAGEFLGTIPAPKIGESSTKANFNLVGKVSDQLPEKELRTRYNMTFVFSVDDQNSK